MRDTKGTDWLEKHQEQGWEKHVSQKQTGEEQINKEGKHSTMKTDWSTVRNLIKSSFLMICTKSSSVCESLSRISKNKC